MLRGRIKFDLLNLAGLVTCAMILAVVSRAVAAGFDLSEMYQDSLEKHFRFDSVIPAAPAFELLMVQPNNILRPANLRDLAVAVSGENFALEFSPALLAEGKNLSLGDYQKRPWLYRTRLSAAAQKGEGLENLSAFAFGLRLTLWDQSDLRTDSLYVASATAEAESINAIYSAAIQNVPPSAGDSSGVINPAKLQLADMARRQLDELANQIREQFAKKKWNAAIWEMAAALKAQSSDTSGAKIKIQESAFWMSLGLSMGSWGQVLVGLNAAYGRADGTASDEFKWRGSGGFRLYGGAANYRGFLEGQWIETVDLPSSQSLKMGVEVRLLPNIWIALSTGPEYSSESKKPRFLSNYELSLGLPVSKWTDGE